MKVAIFDLISFPKELIRSLYLLSLYSSIMVSTIFWMFIWFRTCNDYSLFNHWCFTKRGIFSYTLDCMHSWRRGFCTGLWIDAWFYDFGIKWSGSLLHFFLLWYYILFKSLWIIYSFYSFDIGKRIFLFFLHDWHISDSFISPCDISIQ